MTNDQVADHFGRRVRIKPPGGESTGVLLNMVEGSSDLAEVHFQGDMRVLPIAIHLLERCPRRLAKAELITGPDGLPLGLRVAHPATHGTPQLITNTPAPTDPPKERPCVTQCPLRRESWPCPCKPKAVGF